MCLLVIMCAVALIRTGSGAVVMSDKTVDSDNGSPADICLLECVARCYQTAKTHSCSCVPLCETACGASTINGLPEGSNAASPQTSPCVPDEVGRRPGVSLRSRRRPSRSPTLGEAAVIARSVGLDLGSLDTAAGASDVRGASEVVPRLVSLTPAEDSLTALVSWDTPTHRLSSDTPWYLVTWEPQGGGVRGNLMVNCTSASLTLMPDILYLIQVSSGATSGSLEVDTRPSSSPEAARGVTRGFALPGVEQMGGVTAAVVLFLVILMTVRWRRRISSKVDQSCQDCDIFKLYPPPVTLVEEHKPSPQWSV